MASGGGVSDREAADGGIFVGINFKNLKKPGELHDILHLGRELHEFERGALALRAAAGVDELAESAAVDVVDLGHVQKNFLSSGYDRVVDYVSQPLRSLAEGDGALQVQDQDVPHLPIEIFQGHAATVSRLGAGVKCRLGT